MVQMVMSNIWFGSGRAKTRMILNHSSPLSWPVTHRNTNPKSLKNSYFAYPFDLLQCSSFFVGDDQAHKSLVPAKWLAILRQCKQCRPRTGSFQFIAAYSRAEGVCAEDFDY